MRFVGCRNAYREFPWLPFLLLAVCCPSVNPHSVQPREVFNPLCPQRPAAFNSPIPPPRPGKAGKYRDAGWGVPSRPDLLSEHCEVDVKEYSNFTLQEFRERYFFHKPVIIRNFLNENDIDPVWDRQALMDKYGEERVSVVTGQELNARGFGKPARAETIKNFLQASRLTIPSPSTAEYIIDYTTDSDLPVPSADGREHGFFREHADILDTIPAPLHFMGRGRHTRTYLLIGQDLAGADLHQHPDTWNLLLHGSKRWFFFSSEGNLHPSLNIRPERSRINGRMNLMLDQYESIIPNLKISERPISCIQRAGDLVYIPLYWYHGTISIGESVGISQQFQDWPDGPEPGSTYYWYSVRHLLLGRRYEEAMVRLESLITANPRSSRYKLTYAVTAALISRKEPWQAFFHHVPKVLRGLYRKRRDPIYVHVLLWVVLAPLNNKAAILAHPRVWHMLQLDEFPHDDKLDRGIWVRSHRIKD